MAIAEMKRELPAHALKKRIAAQIDARRKNTEGYLYGLTWNQIRSEINR
jgi:hypothetical protein